MTITAPNIDRTYRQSVARQGAMLFSGYALAQAMSFARNALIGHGLAKGDFGIAATITLLLQVVETLSDLGSDRLIVQDRDGDTPRFMAASHSVLLARGVLLTVLLLAVAPVIARFFAIENAVWGFQLAALTPLIKGFMHLDCRRAQRLLDNRPQLIVEVLPQAVALALTLPALALAHDYAVVVWLSLAQAAASVAISHLLARTPYRLGFDRAILERQISFGWPILVSALPLIAVYQGDRMIIGRTAGMEPFAAYTAAFMVTMVPGLIAAKVGHALMLPMFADLIRQGRRLRSRFTFMMEATTLAAALYLALFLIAGATLLPLCFGANYIGLGNVSAWLAAMWAARMMQAVAGMALMASGSTRPFIVAGVIRALALPVAAWYATHGANIATIAAIGAAAEVCSLAYVALRLEWLETGLGAIFASRALFVLPVALAAVLVRGVVSGGVAVTAVTCTVVLLAVSAIGLTLMPALRAQLRHSFKAAAVPCAA